MERREFIVFLAKFGDLHYIKQWLFTPNSNSDVLPIELYRHERYSELCNLMTMPKKEPLIIFSDIDPFGEEDWS